MFETICCPEGALSPVPEGRSDRSLARSTWTAPPQKSRPVGYGLIRAGMRTDSIIGVISLPKKARRTFRREIPLGLGLRPIIPCPAGRSYWGGAVPGTSCQATIGLSLRD
jgi:hypothetical protein